MSILPASPGSSNTRVSRLPLNGPLMAVCAYTIGMAVFTALASAGASILRLERWARYEGAVLGVALIALGLVVAMHQH